jgi:outer membrane protein assembly factor BamB
MFVADGAVSFPTIAGDLVITGSDDGNVYAIDAARGIERWRFATRGRVSAQPLAVGEMVYVGSLDGRVYALDAATGNERWRVGIANVGYGPVLNQGRLYLVGLDGRVLALGDGPGATPLTDTPPATGSVCGCGAKEPWTR